MKAAWVLGTPAAFLLIGSFAFAEEEGTDDLAPQAEEWSFRVAQSIEQAFSQRLDEKNGRLLEVEAKVQSESLVATNEEAKLELVSSKGEILRLGSKTVAVFQSGRGFRLKAGNALLHLPENSLPIFFSSPVCKVEFTGTGTLLLEVTGNGGFKAIGLSGEPKIVLVDKTERVVKPGHLTFVLENPGKFGPVLDIDLLTLFSTSNLVSGFKEPLACNDELIHSMLLQRTRIRQRTGAFVGDAQNNDSFQLLNVGEKKQSSDN